MAGAVSNPSYVPERLDHLGIVAGVCREIGLAEWLDAQDERRHERVSMGTATIALTLRLLAPRAAAPADLGPPQANLQALLSTAMNRVNRGPMEDLTMSHLDVAHPHEPSPQRRLVAEQVAARLAQMPGVIAIALAGSSVAGVADERSDVDLDVYATAAIPLEQRAELAAALADPSVPVEIGNAFWESGDEWTERGSGIALDILYRTPAWIEAQLERVLERHEASLGYTTCFWHAISVSHALSDPTGWYAQLQARARVPYPEPLRRAILAKNYPVLRRARSSYASQIAAAATRHDRVSLTHRVAALLASYFDVLFALNRVLHPGEKRLVEYVERSCALRPEHMADDIIALIAALGAADEGAVPQQVAPLLHRLELLLHAEGMVPGGVPGGG